MTPKTPLLAVDIIIKHSDGIVLVERKYEPFGCCIPGGFVDIGETVEQAAIREAKEETGLDVELERQFHTYSDPSRDPRSHSVAVVFIANAKGELKAGDDAKEAKIFSLDNLPELVFDHNKILEDFKNNKY
ncbi:NUDIX domain-containing protein [Nanoarchaeota archaeon]